MEPSRSNPFTHLPLEIYQVISEKKHMTLSLVDKTLYCLASKCIQSIYLEPPSDHSIVPNDHLVQLIKRYPHVNKLSLGIFNRMEEPQLWVFIKYLQNHPICHIKKLTIWEINTPNWYLRRQYTNALSHPKLESIIYNKFSLRAGDQVGPILTKAVALKKFKLNCQSPCLVELDFTKQTQLTSATFFKFCAPSSTLESLRSCHKLEILVVSDPFDSVEIMKAIPNFSLNNLKYLELSHATVFK